MRFALRQLCRPLHPCNIQILFLRRLTHINHLQEPLLIAIPSPVFLAAGSLLAASACGSTLANVAPGPAPEVPETVSQIFEPPGNRSELRRQILAADDILFESGFNRCDLAALSGLLLDDVQMVHDQAGIDQGKASFLIPIKENICKGGGAKPIRTLDPDATEIYPLYDDGQLYGALQFGRHTFYLKAEDGSQRLTSRARFLSVWHLRPDGWKFKSAYSYDHLNPDENDPLDADVLESGLGEPQTVDLLLKAHNVQGLALGLLREGQVTEIRSFGISAPERRVTTDTVFNVASLAKPVTALTVLRLADRGDWDLDTPLAEYFLEDELRGFPQAREVTARHILTHTSGLPNWRYLAPDHRLTFSAPPGARYEYSGEGFEWLRRAVEAKTGRSLESLAKELVFTPAGMRSTSYLYPETAPSRVALRYDERGVSYPVAPHTKVNGAANLMTTAEDYARFLGFIASGAGLNPELSAAMSGQQVELGEGRGFSLGWSVLKLPGGDALQHTGSDDGVRSLALLWPDSGDGIVILSNSDSAMPAWQLILSDVFGDRGEAVVAANRR